MQRARLLLGLALVPLLAGSAAALVTAAPSPKQLPIGKADSTAGAARGSVYACSSMGGGGGAFATGSWIHADGTYDLTAKATVVGDVAWPTAVVTFSPGSGGLVVQGNGLPKATHTGTYPVAAESPAYQYDRNPNSIAAQVVDWKLPRPAVAPNPCCLMGGPIGVAVNGVAIFDALDAQNRDASPTRSSTAARVPLSEAAAITITRSPPA